SVEELSQYKGYNVFVTYHSLATVRDAGLKFDVMIIDEAHKTVIENLGKEIWDFDCRKLFLTATPKVVFDNLKKDFGLVSMDDEEFYGKHVFDLSMREAIDRGLLAPYELNIFLADSEQTVRFIEDRR